MQIGQLRPGTALVLSLALAASAHATMITVTSTADSLVVDGNCTLREAIIAANTDTAIDACPAGSGADVIVVPAGTYTLTLTGAGEDAAATGDLDVTADVEIDGAGAAATVIDGNGTDRVFDIDPGEVVSRTVRLSGMTLQNGGGVNFGGAVRSSGILTIADSVVQTSAATGAGGGIYSDGSLSLERCVIRDNSASAGPLEGGAAQGGGITAGFNGYVLNVVDSTISGNTVFAAGDYAYSVGGGISAADLTMTGSTVSGNVAYTEFNRFSPGFPFGGGLSVDNATLRNSTVSGNSAGFGSGIGLGETLTLSNVTVAGLWDGIAFTGPATLMLENTIVSSSVSIACNASLQGSSFTTVGDDYNIDSDGSCGLSGSDIPGVDPQLAPLADNGGPTFTHALIDGSPAIDAGNPAAPGSGGLACEATDQRGVARPVGPRCDIGAFEGSVTSTTTTTSTTVTTTTVTTVTTTTTTTGTTTTTFCPTAPLPGCQPARGGKSRFVLRAAVDNTVDQQLSWRWVSSASVPETNFEDPLTGGNGYTVCVYDPFGRRVEATAPPGRTCGSRPCWKRTSSGFVYRDPFRDPRGLQRILLKAGSAAGRARIKMTGKGSNLPLPRPILPLVLPLRVQVVRDLTATCWEATFSSSRENGPEVFQARSDP